MKNKSFKSCKRIFCLSISIFKFHLHKRFSNWLQKCIQLDLSQTRREVTNNELYFNNMNREDGICFRKSWKPLISSMNDCKKPPSPNPLLGFSNGSQRSMNTTVLALLMTDDMPTTHRHKFSPTFLSSLHMHTWAAGVKV